MNEPQPYKLRPIPALIFASRWLQLPLYLGLIAAQGVYVWQFCKELIHLLHIAAERNVIMKRRSCSWCSASSTL